MINHYYKNIQGWFNFKTFYQEIALWLPDNFAFAEIGVWKGQSLIYLAVEIANLGKRGTIYAVDHWQGSKEHTDPQSVVYEPMLQTNPKYIYEHFLHNILPVKHLITPVRKTSLKAAKIIPDNSLDGVFLDGSHVYEDVLKDLEAWSVKIKRNGYLCGHDYDWPDVRNAVNDYCAKYGQRAMLVPATPSCWVIK
jgi:Methyltransferase domain